MPERMVDINLGINRLGGTRLSMRWKFPDGLITFVANFSYIEGTIPEALSLPPTLQVLHLGSNRITGSIPQTLKIPDSLVRLDISGNQLTGFVPSDWSLPRLQSARLNNNKLRGKWHGMREHV